MSLNTSSLGIKLKNLIGEEFCALFIWTLSGGTIAVTLWTTGFVLNRIDNISLSSSSVGDTQPYTTLVFFDHKSST